MNIADLLNANEGKTLDFKRDLSSPRNILKTVIAFANTAGGVILIGVDDKSRKPLGDEKSLLTLKLLTREQGRLAPTRGAVLLFGRQRLHSFPDAWVQCGRFMGKSKARIFDHIDLHEHLPSMVDGIMLFLKKHAMRGADFSETRRKDVWSIPLEPLREAVINALVHADYSQRGGPVRVAFFDDRIEIENPGILPPGMTVEDMKQGVSKIRNPVIARVFRELNPIEQWGSGVPRIFREAAEMGFPEPAIAELGLRLRFVFPLTTPLPISMDNRGAQSGAQSTAILNALADTPLSTAEIAARLGLDTKTGAFKRAIKELLQQSLIAYTIPEKPTSRLQKYRLTKKGLKEKDLKG